MKPKKSNPPKSLKVVAELASKLRREAEALHEKADSLHKQAHHIHNKTEEVKPHGRDHFP